MSTILDHDINTLPVSMEFTATDDVATIVVPFAFKENIDDIHLEVNAVDSAGTYTYKLTSNNVLKVTPSIPKDSVVYIYRETDVDKSLYTLNDGAVFTASNIDANFNHIRKSQQELIGRFKVLKVRVDSTLSEAGTVLTEAKQATQDAKQATKDVQDAIFGKINDGVVSTWSNRTQRAKNKERITAQDFGAVGDGVTDDTTAFTNLEVSYTKQRIDLLGKVYKVSKDFTGNTYYNGTLKVSYLSNPNKSLPLHTGLKFLPDVGGGEKVLELNNIPFYDTTKGTGSSVTQGATFCFRDKMLYTTRVADGTVADQEYMVIEKYNPYSGYVANALLSSNKSNDIGHQSLGITYKGWYDNSVPSNKYYWSTSGTAKSPYKGAYVCKFTWDETTGDIVAQHFQVTGLTEAYNPDANNAMCISADGSLLCYFYTDSKYNMNKCRIFKTSIFTDTSVDYSNSYFTEFFIERAYYNNTDGSTTGMVVSDIACDGQTVYFLRDAGTSNPSWIQCYDMQGNEIYTDKQVWLGRSDANVILSDGGTYYRECESIFFMPNGGDLDLVMIGALGRRTNLEASGAVPTPAPHTNTLLRTTPSSTLYLKAKGTQPLINILAGTNGVTINSGGVLSFGESDSTGTPSNFFYIKKNQLNVETTSGEPQYRVANSLHSGLLQVSASGNFGLFSTKYSKWVVALNSAGTQAFASVKFYATQGLNVGTTSVYADNATAKTGGLVSGDVYRTSDGTLKIVY